MGCHRDMNLKLSDVRQPQVRSHFSFPVSSHQTNPMANRLSSIPIMLFLASYSGVHTLAEELFTIMKKSFKEVVFKNERNLKQTPF